MPTDVARVGRKIATTLHGDPAPTDPDDYHTIASSGFGTFNLVWQPEQARMRCYLITWFINYRGETGPESVPLVFDII